MIAIYIILGLIVVIAAICLVRTALNRPSAAAASAKIPYENTERSAAYGEALGNLIRSETVSSRFSEDKTKFYEFHKVLERQFPNLHSVCEKHVFNGSLLFKWSGKGQGRPIMLMSHHDVVEAGGKWEHPPFGGEIVDGVLWGRGTVDTKGSLFCFLTAVEELIGEGYVPNCDVYLASSCTEEFSGEGAPLTAKYLKEQGVRLRMLLDEGGMITGEPIGGVKGMFAMIGVLEKGYGDLKFIARGKGGHASAPPKNTPLVRLAAFITHIEKHDPFKSKLHPTILEMFRRLSPYTGFGFRLILSNLWLFGGLLKKLMGSISPSGAAMMKTTTAFTMAQGSGGLNVLPQEAYVTGNLRFIHHQGTKESIELIKGIAKKFDIDTEVIYSDEPCPIVDYKGAEFKLVEETIREQFGDIGISPYAMTGGTDCKFYNDVCDNALRFAPLYASKQQVESIHGLNENLDVKVLPFAVDFYKRLIKKA